MNTRSYFAPLLLVFQLAAGYNCIAATGQFQEFYVAFQSDDTTMISRQLNVLEGSSIPQKDAYSGALMMKMSGLVKSGMEKLKVFKKGRVMLENCIMKDSLNAEYRFLRLIIQENIPDFMNYHSKKKEDAGLIKESFSKMSPHLQKAISEYSKRSQVLKPEDFQK